MNSEKSQSLLNNNLLFVLFLAAVISFFNYGVLKDFKQLPSPLYGGDLWSHMGSIYHIYYGGSILDSSQLIGEIPWVPWFYYIPILAISAITGLDPMLSLFWLNIPLIFIGSILAYLLIKNYTNDILLILAAVLVLLYNYPVFKYTDFAFYIMMPALLVSWLYYLKNKTLQNKLILIAIIALSNLTNTQLFFSQYILFGLIVINDLYKLYIKEKTAFEFGKLIELLRPYLEIFVISFIISLVYWYWPLFVYKGSTPNDLQIYGWADYSQFNVQTTYIIDVFKAWYPINSSIHTTAFTLLKILGIFLIIKLRNKDRFHNFAFMILLTAFIGLTHHLVTFNLFHIHFAPERLYGMVQTSLIMLQIVIAANWLKERKFVSPVASSIGVLTFLIIVLVFSDIFGTIEKNSYYQNAKSDIPGTFIELKNWVLKNTDVYDVFITTNEDAFALNSFTGRKVVSYRRTHTSTYADLNARMLDQAAILYGNNDELRKTLLKKYKVKYLYWSVSWLSNEFRFNEEGAITGIFDPLMVPSKPEYKKFLDENGIEYIETVYYLDPAWQPNYPTYNVLVVVPKEKRFDHPWSYDLDNYIYEVKKFEEEEQPYWIVYGVKNG
ncbi:hypothetical protein HYT84_00065 [Candidatus Micrarchaeota archaeon]|nr:hypothetical protein [Candidatus Micrarchaeota archaeon]